MEHLNGETIRKGFNAFMQGHMTAAESVFHPDVIWHIPGVGPLSGDFHGFEAIARWGSELAARSGGTFGGSSSPFWHTTTGPYSSRSTTPSAMEGSSRTSRGTSTVWSEAGWQSVGSGSAISKISRVSVPSLYGPQGWIGVLAVLQARALSWPYFRQRRGGLGLP